MLDCTGMDSLEHCADPERYKNYQFPVKYQYNSRGFRDQEWPKLNDRNVLRDAIWCLGDSFTEGLGSAASHTWPVLLQKATGLRVINVSLDGASNQWIARKARYINDHLAPRHLIVMWSYLHRRELDNDDASDEDRRIWTAHTTVDQDMELHKSLVHAIDQQLDNVIHSWIPMFAPDQDTGKKLIDDLRCRRSIGEVPYLDLARDGHHFDRNTARWVVEQVKSLLGL